MKIRQRPRPEGDQSWWDRAACRGRKTAEFFRESAHPHLDPALRVCAGCPVQAACLAEALEVGEEYGVWGGTTASQRRRMLRASGAPPTSVARYGVYR